MKDSWTFKEFDNGNTIVMDKSLSFEKWIGLKYGSIGDYLSLKYNDKRKIFLKWKWGLENNDSNEDLEMTRKFILRLVEGRTFKNEDEQFYWENTKKWEKDCDDVMYSVGLKI